jgi:hypothetical protein
MDTPLPVLPYARSFVAALDWGVRGAALQFGGRMSVVDGEGREVYRATLGSRMVFLAIGLSVLALGLIATSMADNIWRWTSRAAVAPITAAGAICLAAAIWCYVLSSSKMRFDLRSADGTLRAMVHRGRSGVRWESWTLSDPTGQTLGHVALRGELSLLDPQGRPLLTVSQRAVPGLGAALWRQVDEGTGTSRGRLRVAIGAGARLQMSHEVAVNPAMLAAMVVIIAVRGKT